MSVEASTDTVLAGIRAAAEPTRLRLLALCSAGELTVTELTEVLGQSQPRVSRHLKVLCDAGLLERFREGAWVFYRAVRDGAGAQLVRAVLALLPEADEAMALDRRRLAEVKRARAEAAAAYFRANAARWNSIRSLYVDEAEVEAAVSRAVLAAPVRDLLDIGTGTGRMLEVLGPRVRNAVGIDASREMLAVARAHLDRAGCGNCSVRQADMYRLPFADATWDAAVLHQVLHYAHTPEAVLVEAARVLRPGGRLVVVDFAPHHLEFLRDEHNHRRLGFGDDEMAAWFRLAALAPAAPMRLPGDPLTVVVWSGRREANNETRGEDV